MGKIKNWLIVVCFVCWWNCGISQPILTQENKLRNSVINTAINEVGVRELTNNNDGIEVEKYLSTVNLSKGNAWCCAFVVWVFNSNNIDIPLTGYCPDLFKDKKKVVFQKNVKTIKPFLFKKGQVFGLYFESKKRVAHVGIIEKETRFNYLTIEGNTNEKGAREGDGVYKKIRNKRNIYIIADFIKH